MFTAINGRSHLLLSTEDSILEHHRSHDCFYLDWNENCYRLIIRNHFLIACLFDCFLWCWLVCLLCVCLFALLCVCRFVLVCLWVFCVFVLMFFFICWVVGVCLFVNVFVFKRNFITLKAVFLFVLNSSKHLT